NSWSEIDGAFNYQEFYNNIIELIEDSPDPEWKEDLLKAWNVKIFENEEGHDRNSTMDDNKNSGSCEGRDNDLARVRAQMVAHCAAKVAPARPPSPPPSVSPPLPPLLRATPRPVPAPRQVSPRKLPAPSAPTPVPPCESMPAPREPTLAPSAPKQISPCKHPAPSAPAPVRAESSAPSELTGSELDESEPVQTKCKCKAKKGSTKVSKPKCGEAAPPAGAKPWRSSRK
ncbi:hypothetical protein BDR04DRAFT_1153814, partial [Suillus decipiens]